MSESQIMMSDFQSVSKKTGDEYEAIVEMDLIDRGLIIYHKNFYIEGTGCEVDFVAGSSNSRLEYVEAKGGQRGLKKRPGAKRTDNVKKAIANAALIKAIRAGAQGAQLIPLLGKTGKLQLRFAILLSLGLLLSDVAA